MNRFILALSILAVSFVCVPALAQNYPSVPSVPGDGIPDFYYFNVDSVMPEGAIYAGEVFPAGTFVIDPDGPDWGLLTMQVEGPPALGFDDNPTPGETIAPRHTNAGSIVTATVWNPDREMYLDALLAEQLGDFAALREWAAAHFNSSMQAGIIGGPPLMSMEKDGEPYEAREILTKTFIYQGGLEDQFDIVWISGGKIDNPHYNNQVATPVTIAPEPSPGDASFDGVVDRSDFNLWNASKFGGDVRWANGDFTRDGTTDLSDFNIWNANKFAVANGGPAPAPTQVPEPSTFVLLGCALAAIGYWRRKKRAA